MAVLTNISLRLPIDLVERIAELAKHTGRSKTYYMQEAIKQHLEDLEDLYMAEAALIDLKMGKSRLIALEEMENEFGLDDKD